MENSYFFSEMIMIKTFVFNNNPALDDTFISEIYRSKIYNSDIFKYMKIGNNIDFHVLGKIENMYDNPNLDNLIIDILKSCKSIENKNNSEDFETKKARDKNVRIDTASLILKKMIEKYQTNKNGISTIKKLFNFIFHFK